MSTGVITDSNAPRASIVVRAAALTGALFIIEAVASLVIDSHVGYHAINVPLNMALVVAAVAMRVRTGGRAITAGVIVTVLGAALAAAGGAVALVTEGLSGATAPEATEGIAHTAVPLSLLGLISFGIGLGRRFRAGYLVAAAAAVSIALVLGGLDPPEAFLVPEAALGAGWLLLAARAHAGTGVA